MQFALSLYFVPKLRNYINSLRGWRISRNPFNKSLIAITSNEERIRNKFLFYEFFLENYILLPITFLYFDYHIRAGGTLFQKLPKNTLTFSRFCQFLRHLMSLGYFNMQRGALYCLFLFWKDFKCQTSSIIRHYTN